MKKRLIAIIVAIIAIGGGIGGYVYHSNQVKAVNIAKCRAKANEIRMSSIRLTYGLKFIIWDYTTNWNSSIENNLAINMKNKIVDCEDFSKAMSWRWSFYDSVGSFHRIDSCLNKMGNDITILVKNEESDQQLTSLFKKELDLLEKLKVMSKKPNGSLLEYTSKTASVFGKLDELDNKVSKTVPLEELSGSERVKETVCGVWGEGLIDFPKAKTKVIKVTAKDLLFIDLRESLNTLSVQ